MTRNLDDFAKALNQVTVQAAQAAVGHGKARALLRASANGDAATVQQIAASMTTVELQRFQHRHG
ncbi:hypothetical protein [Streptomyces sp. NPDC000229]|uniref:hypothetical protein n=1 Tax=Streptomyces sp. NPDC000229 TaxID=3154247 RepID=UPI00331821CC